MSLTPLEKVELLVKNLIEVKAGGIVRIDVTSKSTITDYVLVVQGRSQAQVRGISDEMEMRLKEENVRPLGVEGYNEGSWILMDYDTTIIHIFHPETRQKYRIEELHSGCPTETFGEDE